MNMFFINLIYHFSSLIDFTIAVEFQEKFLLGLIEFPTLLIYFRRYFP